MTYDQIKKLIDSIMCIETIKKHQAKFEAANAYLHDLHIPLYNTNKRQFTKTIQQIEKIEGVKRVSYEKRPDGTIFDFLRVYY